MIKREKIIYKTYLIKREKIETNDDKVVNHVAVSVYYLLMKGNEPFFSVKIFNFLQKFNSYGIFSTVLQPYNKMQARHCDAYFELSPLTCRKLKVVVLKLWIVAMLAALN